MLRELSDGLVFVVSFDDVEGVGEGLAPVVDLSAAEVAGAEDCWDFVGGDHFFVFEGYFWAALRNMEITDYQGQLTHLLFFCHELIDIKTKQSDLIVDLII